jgi:hypothetical protein
MPGFIICAGMGNKIIQYRIENEVVTPNGKLPFIGFLTKFPESSILQIPSFAVKFYAKRNCRVFRLFKNDIIVGVCLVSEYLFNAEIQFGPQVISETDTGVFIEKICGFYKKRFYGQIKISFPTNIQNETCEEVVTYVSQKFALIKELIGNWSSLVIKLNEENQVIQKGYSENLKRNIKKAVQHGLSVRKINHEKDISGLGIIFDKLYQWRKVKPQWKDSSTTFLSWFRSEELLDKTIWFGVYNTNDDLLGGIMMVAQKDTLFYQLGASDPEERSLPILHLCFHQAIIFANENNFSFFDFGGYDTDAQEDDQTYNINSFKKQFGGELVTSFPNVLIVLNKPVKILIDLLMNIRNRI